MTEAGGPGRPTSGDPTGPPVAAGGRDPHLAEGWAAGPRGHRKRTPARSGLFHGWASILLVAFVIALLLKTFLVQAFYIPSESMEPTLLRGDRVLVSKIDYRIRPPHRGDVIVFADPRPGASPNRGALGAFWRWLAGGLGLPSGEEDFIKRVVGLPGETVEGKDGVVYVDGRAIEEPYVTTIDPRPFGPYQVPSDRLFVLGDNRLHSMDSRYGLGFVPYRKIIGRAVVLMWPPTRIGRLSGP